MRISFGLTTAVALLSSNLEEHSAAAVSLEQITTEDSQLQLAQVEAEAEVEFFSKLAGMAG